MWEFTSPRTIAFGEEALEYLGDIEGERVFIVCGKSVEKLGILKRVADVLKQAGLDVEVFNEVEPEPSIATVVNGSRKMASFGPDWIVAVGGGSSMDAAKAMWVLYERPDLAVEMINPFEKLGLRKKAKLICIPTTSGSGSEATWATVVTDAQLALKMELASRELVPDIVILDPRMPASMSPHLTAQSGLDVLAHAIETYVSDYRNDFSEALALRAIQLVFRYLPEVYKNGESIEARSKMHSAATMAGLAFGNAQLSISHSMGHSFGAVFKVPHGRSVGLFLPLSIEFSS
ncbi:MAG: iron-containing alcohol dehydrogenase, partial [Methanomassiliicoccales archaeon]|nr:iron-containing alcohol dehydrogenase [Methanomassiliicoccales archaeon]